MVEIQKCKLQLKMTLWDIIIMQIKLIVNGVTELHSESIRGILFAKGLAY